MKTFQILLIEDNLGDVELFRYALNLQNTPYHLQVLKDGEEAISYLKSLDASNRPDIMLLDLNLPKMDGISVLGEFSRMPEAAAIPVIAVTSSDYPADRVRTESFGIRHYFRKPLDLPAFLKIGPLVFSTIQEGISNPALQLPT